MFHNRRICLYRKNFEGNDMEIETTVRPLLGVSNCYDYLVYNLVVHLGTYKHCLLNVCKYHFKNNQITNMINSYIATIPVDRILVEHMGNYTIYLGKLE